MYLKYLKYLYFEYPQNSIAIVTVMVVLVVKQYENTLEASWSRYAMQMTDEEPGRVDYITANLPPVFLNSST